MVLTMDRRLLMTALACWPAARLLARDEEPRPRHKISAAALHDALSSRFPVRIGLAGLLELQVSAPSLHLLPARNRLGATLVTQVSGAQLRRPHIGEVDVAFALRYEAADQTVRAHRPEILDFRWPGLTPEAVQALQRVLPEMAREAVGEVVLHRFTPRELALPDTMGFEPEKVTVVEDGLLILFGPKPRA
jgi:hypothetical protein